MQTVYSINSIAFTDVLHTLRLSRRMLSLGSLGVACPLLPSSKGRERQSTDCKNPHPRWTVVDTDCKRRPSWKRNCRHGLHPTRRPHTKTGIPPLKIQVTIKQQQPDGVQTGTAGQQAPGAMTHTVTNTEGSMTSIVLVFVFSFKETTALRRPIYQHKIYDRDHSNRS